MKKSIIIVLVLIIMIVVGCSPQEGATTDGAPDTAVVSEPETSATFTDVPATKTPQSMETIISEPPADGPTTAVITSPAEIISITAKSGSASDIQAAVDAVSRTNGGTVYIPEGDFNFGGHLTIRSGIKLIGAGKDKTILRTRGPSMMIHANGENIRISGFSLISENNDGSNGIVIEDCIDFRVDHLNIEGYSDQAAVYVSGANTRGVIDHCDIKLRNISNLGYGVVVYGDDTWKDNLQLGTEYAVFIEDNTFTNTRHAVAANKGAHYVFRHNIVNQEASEQAVDAHGPYWGSDVGTQAVEIYNNEIVTPVANGSERAIGIRGGSGVIFDNVIKGYTYAVMLIIEDKQDLSSYPVYHQVHDLYIWNNTYDGDDEVIVQRENRATRYIKEDRDYFLYPKEGYEPYPYPHPLTLE